MQSDAASEKPVDKNGERPKTLGEKIRGGVRWLMLGNAGNQLLDFVFGISLARLLVPADFGIIVAVRVFTGFMGMLASGGMGQSLIRAKEAGEDDFRCVFTMQFIMGVLIYLGFFAAAPLLGRFLNNELYIDLLRVSAVSFMIRPFAFTRNAWLTRQMQFKKRALVNIAMAGVTGVASVLMAASGLGVWSLTLSGLVGGLASNVLLAQMTPLRLRLQLDRQLMRKHSGFGFKITVSEFLTYVIEQSTNFILSKMAGPELLGLYNKAESLARMPNRLITPATGQTVFRALATVQEDKDQTKYIYYRTITLLMVYVLPSLLGLWWIADPLVGLVYGDKWVPSVEPLKVIILIGLIRTVTAPSSVLLTAQNRLSQQLVVQAIGVLVGITSCVVGLRWGLSGVAWGALCTALYFFSATMLLVRRTIRTRIGDLGKAAGPALLLNALLFGVLALVHHLFGPARTEAPWVYVLAMVCAGGASYACAFLFLPIPPLRSEALRWRNTVLFIFGAKRGEAS